MNCIDKSLCITSMMLMTMSKNPTLLQKVLEDWLRLPERQELFAGLAHTPPPKGTLHNALHQRVPSTCSTTSEKMAHVPTPVVAHIPPLEDCFYMSYTTIEKLVSSSQQKKVFTYHADIQRDTTSKMKIPSRINIAY